MNLDFFKQEIRKITPFTEEECDFFEPYLQPLSLKKGDFFLQAGQKISRIGFIEEGVMRLYYNLDGQEINKFFFLETDYTVAFSDYLTGDISRYSIQALEDCKLITFNSEAMTKAYLFSKNWENFGRNIAESAYIQLNRRLESFLFKNAKERYLEMLQVYPKFIDRIPLYHLASFLGIERESLSRIRKDLLTD